MQIGIAIAHWLRENQQSNGRILDPVHHEYGTYADGFAALTFGLMALRTGDAEWETACRRSLETARRRPRESEFDQLALLLTAASGARCGKVWKDDLAAVLLYRGRRLVSNNWVAMRALNYTLRSRLTGSAADGEEAARLWKRVLGWQAADGLFLDSPRGEATPVTYHAKFCAMLALALTEARFAPVGSKAAEEQNRLLPQEQSLRAALRQGLAALQALVSPSGVLVPYGRSRNTLFGYAAAILALRRGANLFDRSDFAEAACRLTCHLGTFQRGDGHIPCVLNAEEAEKADWDVYFNNPDYNAYAAALLLFAEDTTVGKKDESSGRPQSAPSMPATHAGEEPAGTTCQIRHIGPILTVRRDGLFAAFSAEGQSAPFGTPFFCDHRYYGMQPLWIEQDGKALFEPPSYRWRGGEDRTSLVDPTANPWIPYLTCGDRRYCVRRYDRIEVRQNGDTVEIEAEGRPEVYRPVPRLRRGLHALLSARTEHAGPMFSAQTLTGVYLRRRLVWNVTARSLRAVTEVSGSLPPGTELHQGTRAFAEE